MLDWLRATMTRAAVTVLSLIPNYIAHLDWPLADMAGHFLRLVSDGYRKNSIVYACVRLKATSVPEAPLRIYEIDNEGAETESPSHPLRLLLEYVNPYQTEFEFWELTVTNLEICGRAPWWKERDRAGRVVALWPLRPDRLGVIPGDTSVGEPFLKLYGYMLDGEMTRIPPRDVMMFTYPDPGDETGGVIGGYGPLQVLAREVDADNEATTFVYALLRNYAAPGILIKTKANLDKDSAQQLKDRIKAAYGGLRRGEPAVLSGLAGGDSEITTLSHNLQQLEFPDLRAIAESRISSAFGVPAILVGLKVGLDRSTFANMSEAREFFAETTLSVMWRRLSDQVQSDLVPEFGDPGRLKARFDTGEVKALAGQRAQYVAPIIAGFAAGGVLLNEYRLALGLLPVAGGDVFVRALTLVEVPAVYEGSPVRGMRMLPRRMALPAPRSLRALPAPNAAKWLRMHEQRVAQLRDALAPRLDTYWAKIGKAVVAALPGETKSASLKAALPDDFDPDTLLPDNAEPDLLKLIAAHWQMSIDTSADDVKALLSAMFDLPMAEVQAVLDTLATRITAVNDTTKADVRRVVGNALEKGASNYDLRDQLKGLFEETYKNRSLAIARTESANAYNTGSALSYRASGVVDGVLIYDGTDFDDACREANGQTWTVEQFQAHPTQHTNCTRAGAPVLKKLEG
jgi:HK97 family phage portal protein